MQALVADSDAYLRGRIQDALASLSVTSPPSLDGFHQARIII
jgi:phage-related baseplate assembly protein